jgi:hypothetical protein
MKLSSPVFFGRRSQIFDLGDQTVLKLYDIKFPKSKIISEFEKTKIVFNSKLLNVPRPIKLINYQKRTGIIFEKIEGLSYMDLFMQKPWLFLTYTPKIIEVHKKIHSVLVNDLPRQEKEFENVIKTAKRLTVKDKSLLLEKLNDTYAPTLCHGDFHHGNLIEDKKGKVYILDWMDAFLGDYRLDVALTAVNAVVSDAPKHIPVIYRNAYELLKKILKLDKRYLKFYGLNETDIKDQLCLAAGIHLARCNRNDDSFHRGYFEYTKQNTNVNVK